MKKMEPRSTKEEKIPMQGLSSVELFKEKFTVSISWESLKPKQTKLISIKRIKKHLIVTTNTTTKLTLINTQVRHNV